MASSCLRTAGRAGAEATQELGACTQAQHLTPKTRRAFQLIPYETSWIRKTKCLHQAGDCHIELNLIMLVKGFVFLYQQMDTSRISKQKDDWK